MPSKYLKRLAAMAAACALMLPFAACEMDRQEEFIETPEAQEPFPADTLYQGTQPGMQPGTQPGMQPGTTGTPGAPGTPGTPDTGSSSGTGIQGTP